MTMEKQDRIQQLEQLGLAVHQSWMGKVCSWNPVESMQYAMQPDLLPESRTLFNDLLRMNQSWMQMGEQWSSLTDSGMPWHWNGMGHELDSIPPSSDPSSTRTESTFPKTWPIQPKEHTRPAAPAPHKPKQPVQPNSLPPTVQKQSKNEAEFSKSQQLPAAETSAKKEEKKYPSTVKPAFSSRKESTDLHEERKNVDQPLEEPQVTFRRLDDFAAMFRPGADQGKKEELNQTQPENRNQSLPIPPAEDSPSHELSPLNSVKNSPQASISQPIANNSERQSSLRNPQMNPPASQLKSDSRTTKNVANQSIQKTKLAQQKPFSEPATSPAEKKVKLSTEQIESSAPAWEQLHKAWNQKGTSPETILQKNTSQKNLPLEPAEHQSKDRPQVQTETDSTVAQAKPAAETFGLKPGFSERKVTSYPQKDLSGRKRSMEEKEVEIENVMDQLLDQLQRDFKRYYGG